MLVRLGFEPMSAGTLCPWMSPWLQYCFGIPVEASGLFLKCSRSHTRIVLTAACSSGPHTHTHTHPLPSPIHNRFTLLLPLQECSHLALVAEECGAIVTVRVEEADGLFERLGVSHARIGNPLDCNRKQSIAQTKTHWLDPPHPVTHLHEAEDCARAHKTKATALELAGQRIHGL